MSRSVMHNLENQIHKKIEFPVNLDKTAAILLLFDKQRRKEKK